MSQQDYFNARKDDNIIVLTVINPATGALIDIENHKFAWHSIDENNLYTALGNNNEIQIPSAKILNSKT